MKNEKFQESVIKNVETYLLPVAVVVAIVMMMAVNAYLWGRSAGTSVGIMVMCGEVLGAAWVMSYVSNHCNENDDAHTIE